MSSRIVSTSVRWVHIIYKRFIPNGDVWREREVTIRTAVGWYARADQNLLRRSNEVSPECPVVHTLVNGVQREGRVFLCGRSITMSTME